jgi:hypothetical protein
VIALGITFCTYLVIGVVAETAERQVSVAIVSDLVLRLFVLIKAKHPRYTNYPALSFFPERAREFVPGPIRARSHALDYAADSALISVTHRRDSEAAITHPN